MTTDILLETYNVDREHARHVADLALVLFDSLYDIHSVSTDTRRLLEIGALLHNVGLQVDERLHHIVGRDIVLRSEFPELSESERELVACLVSFHRKKVRPQQEPAFLSLKSKQQDVALRLAALLRVADGLDYGASQSTHIDRCDIADDTVIVWLSGPEATDDGKRAVKKADLWQKVFGKALTFQLTAADTEQNLAATQTSESVGNNGHQPAQIAAEEPPQQVAAQAADTEAQPVITSEDTLAEFGRWILRRHYQKLLAREQDVREDTDIEGVHQMRVATRRLRSALMMMREVAPKKKVRHFRREIQRLARTSSAVRDGDVFLDQVAQYQEDMPADQREGLTPLVKALRYDRAAAHTQLLKYLDSQRYARFKRDFATFMTRGSEDWNTHLRVCDVAGSIIWQHYERLRAHEVDLNLEDQMGFVDTALHDARITGKRLRYVLELFAEVLGPRADQVIKPLKELQDGLGGLQDIAVAKAYITALDVSHDDKAALDAYVAVREAERAQLLASLPRAWEKVTQTTYRRKLMDLIIKL